MDDEVAPDLAGRGIEGADFAQHAGAPGPLRHQLGYAARACDHLVDALGDFSRLAKSRPAQRVSEATEGHDFTLGRRLRNEYEQRRQGQTDGEPAADGRADVEDR